MDTSLQTLAERVRAAATDGTTLRIRGGGTKDFYGEAPRGDITVAVVALALCLAGDVFGEYRLAATPAVALA